MSTLSSIIAQSRRRFNPLSLSPALWLDASDASTLYSGASLAAPDGAISEWRDKSGNARHATQSTGVSQPLRKTAIRNGRDVVRFDGSNDFLDTTSYALPSDYSIFLIAKADSWIPATTYRGLVSHAYNGTDAATKGMLVAITSATLADWVSGDMITFGSGFTSGRAPRAIGPVSAGSDFRLVSSIIGAGGSRTRINGAQTSTRVETDGGISASTNPFSVGRSGPLLNQLWLGDISEIVTFHRAVTETERLAVESYLRAKWGTP